LSTSLSTYSGLKKERKMGRPANWVEISNKSVEKLKKDGFDYTPACFSAGADAMEEALIKTGVRAGYATRTTGGIKASATDGHLWFLGDIADKLFGQMQGKDGFLVFIPKDTALKPKTKGA
jgi:hypothetical protein